ncbi:MAG: hypothetical protein V4733_02605, partial [Verrucomicrobiota bacterium]
AAREATRTSPHTSTSFLKVFCGFFLNGENAGGTLEIPANEPGEFFYNQRPYALTPYIFPWMSRMPRRT